MNFGFTKDVLEAAAYAVAVIAGLGAGTSFIVRQLNKRKKRIQETWTGLWTNEGDVTGPIPSHYIDLTLKARDGELSGVVTSSLLSTETFAPNRSVQGSYRGRRAKIEIFHIRGGERLDEASAQLSLDKRNLLNWKLHNGIADFYPIEARCWKLDPS